MDLKRLAAFAFITDTFNDFTTDMFRVRDFEGR